jgi:hypothetical protein
MSTAQTRMGRPPSPADGRDKTIRLYLTETESTALDSRAQRAKRSRNAQVTHEIKTWLESKGEHKIDRRSRGSIPRTAVRLPAAILAQLEQAVGVDQRTRAIETAVRHHHRA